MCEARGLPATRIGVVDQGSDAHRGSGLVHRFSRGSAQHVGGRASRVVRVSAPPRTHPLLVWAWSLVHLDFVGVAFGTLFFCLSLTPSLLPRDWLFQGLISGLNAAIGYGIGVFRRKRSSTASCYVARTWWPPS